MSPPKVSREMLIVTGMSGAGRSTVGNALEDLGWYVVDNLPPQMLKPLVDLAGHTGEAIPKVAAMVDVRGGKLFADVLDALEILRRKTHVRVLFLDATDAVLVRRFEQVRRPHPLQGDGTLLDGITAERARMSELRELSDFVIDTTDLNIHQLATARPGDVRRGRRGGHEGDGHELRVQVRAPAGRRHGRRLPVPAESVLDPGAERAHRPRRPGERLRARPAGRRGVHRVLRRDARARCSPGTVARTSGTLRSLWVARAGNIAPSPSPRSSGAS